MSTAITQEHVGRQVVILAGDHMLKIGTLTSVLEIDSGTRQYGVVLNDGVQVAASKAITLPDNDTDARVAFTALHWAASDAHYEMVNRLAAVEDRVVQLVNRVDERERENRSQRTEFAQFKRQAVEVAKRLAEELSEDGCTVVRDAVVDELGLEWPEQSYKFTVRVEHIITAKATGSRTFSDEDDAVSFFGSSISVDDDGQLTVDSDWEVEYEHATVDTVDGELAED